MICGEGSRIVALKMFLKANMSKSGKFNQAGHFVTLPVVEFVLR
jgi:hypothetical protein